MFVCEVHSVSVFLVVAMSLALAGALPLADYY